MKRLGFVAAIFSVLILAGCVGGVDYAKLESDFVAKASKYYEDNMRTTYKITQFSVSLSALEASKVDIKKFTDEKCDKESYVLVNVTLDKDGKPVGNYTTEAHLTCENYKTPTK